jgi:hypothetical protein
VLERWSKNRDGVGVKISRRGGTLTRKAEFDDLARDAHDHASRQALRRKVEKDD